MDPSNGIESPPALATHGAERLMERALAESQRLEALSRLCSGFTHGLGDLLTVVAGNASLLRTHLAQDPAAAELAEEIERAAARAGTLVQQVAAFGRERAHAQVPLAANDLVRRAVASSGVNDRPDIRCHLLLAPQLPPVVADPGHLEQALVALLRNAMDAMPQGGRLAVTTVQGVVNPDDVRTTPWLRPGGTVRVTITDSGIGMPEPVRARALEPFFTTKTAGAGTGLGLSLAWGVVQQARGRLHLHSAPGAGTVVTIDLPPLRTRFLSAPGARRPSLPVVPPGPAPTVGPESWGNGAAPVSRATVLLVDDDDLVRAAVHRALRREGYAVLEAADADMAMALAAGHAGTIDLLIADRRLPPGSGAHLAERLRQARPRVRALIIGSEDAVLQEGGQRSTPLPFLQKPFTLEALQGAVRQALEGTGTPAVTAAR
jgi:two-component system cell cycle sensor histidine kinase/response regulator CckA